MATTSYEYNKNDNLTIIANLFNTTKDSLVRLNSWLKDDTDGHTQIKPILAKSKTILKFDRLYVIPITIKETNKSISAIISASSKSDAMSKLYRTYLKSEIVVNTDGISETYTSQLSSPARPKTVEIYHKLMNKNEYVLYAIDDGHNNICEYNNDANIIGYVDYDTGLIITFNNYTDVKLRVEFCHKYIIVPLIGSGNTSVEDYWNNLDKITGLQHSVQLDNFVADSLETNYASTSPNTETGQTFTYETAVLSDWSNIDAPSYIDPSTVNFISQYINDVTMNSYNGGNATYVSNKTVSDFANFTQMAIDVLNCNVASRTGSSPELNINSKSKFTSRQGVSTGTSYAFVGNPAYGKCKVIIGSTVLNMPCYPDSVSDSTDVSYNTSSILGRSEPYSTYNNSGPRTISFTFNMHREMTGNEAEIEQIVRYIESAVYPNYNSNVAPIRVQVYIGKTIYISGIMTSETTDWSGPIDDTDKYNLVNVSFTIQETTGNPKSASYVQRYGGYRVGG